MVPDALIVAMDELLLTHVPPEVGLMLVVDPMHMSLGPINTSVGLPFTMIADVGLEAQPADVV